MKAPYVRSSSALDINPHSDENYVDLKDVYLGVLATTSLQEIQGAEPKEVEKLHSTARDFYVGAINQIKTRFKFSDLDHYKDAEFLIPDNARNLVPTALFQVARKYRPIDFGNQLKFDLAKLDMEWREQSILNNDNLDLHEYWKQVFSAKDGLGRPRFPELSNFVCLFFSLPFSNALTERLFSCLKNVKSYKRNRLDNETLSSLLCVKYGVRRSKNTYKHFLKNKVPQHQKVGQIVANASATNSKAIRLGQQADEQPSISSGKH